MSESWKALGEVFGICLLPAVAMAAGSVLVQYYRPGRLLSTALEQFAAGVVLGALGLDLLSMLSTAHGLTIIAVNAGFISGVIFMFLMGRVVPLFIGDPGDILDLHELQPLQVREKLIDASETLDIKISGPIPMGFVASVVINSVIDGTHRSIIAFEELLLTSRVHNCYRLAGRYRVRVGQWCLGNGHCFGGRNVPGMHYPATANPHLLLIRQTLSCAQLGVTVSVAFNSLAIPRKTAIKFCLAMPVGIPISGALGSALLVQLNPEGSMFLCIIAFGSASLIYLITNELLTAVHMNPDCDRWFISVQLFVGFWVTMLLKVRTVRCPSCTCGCLTHTHQPALLQQLGG